jgi:hypothetical protein
MHQLDPVELQQPTGENFLSRLRGLHW